MKKTIILAAAIFFLCRSITLAQTIDSSEYGISFDISENWALESDNDSFVFRNKRTNDELIQIEMTVINGVYDMEQLTEETLKNMCSNVYSDRNLSYELSAQNRINVTVTSQSVVTSYENHGGNLFFRYEKAYLASASGFDDTFFYKTSFITLQNGRVYFISYQRKDDNSGFPDVTALLETLSFSSGEIKITINGERVFPDKSPIILSDRTLVPIRVIAEKMGYKVSWYAAEQLITLTEIDGSTILHFAIGSDVALKNLTQEIMLDAQATIVGNRTFLPLRAVTEAMGAEVSWNSADRTVEIATKDYSKNGGSL